MEKGRAVVVLKGELGSWEATITKIVKAATFPELTEKLNKMGVLQEAVLDHDASPIEEVSSPIDVIAAEMMELWNSNRGGLPACKGLNHARKQKIARCFKEQSDPKEWVSVIRWLASDLFFSGRKPGSHWKADFDFLIRPGTYLKIKEKMDSQGSGNRIDYNALLKGDQS